MFGIKSSVLAKDSQTSSQAELDVDMKEVQRLRELGDRELGG